MSECAKLQALLEEVIKRGMLTMCCVGDDDYDLRLNIEKALKEYQDELRQANI